jgi:CHAT domain-containing protein
LLDGAEVDLGAQSTEGRLKQLHSPWLLHVATHGFFLKDQPDTLTTGREFGVGRADVRLRSENPLLRSGLALAGANRRESGADDGILTALEVSGMDLTQTELVVLSACETGVGEVRNGDGVYGLRRALVIAGAQSEVMSLWRVDDDATRDLMVAYYRRLLRGEGRSEALRAVQLEMLRGGRLERASGASAGRSHPFYWASFILSGDWRPLATATNRTSAR